MVLRGSASRNAKSLEKEPARAILNAQSTSHGARTGLELAPQSVYTQAPGVPRSRERNKRPAAGREKLAKAQKNVNSTQVTYTNLVSYIHTRYIIPGMYYTLCWYLVPAYGSTRHTVVLGVTLTLWYIRII